MKVIAQRGGGVFLVAVDEPSTNMTAQGFIIDLEAGVRYRSMNVHSILARGYWSEFDGDEATLLDAIPSLETK